MDGVAFKELTAAGVAAAVRAAIPLIATRTRPDFMDALREAAARETGERARSVLAMMLENDDIARRDHVPICQDTGSVWVYLEVGCDQSVPGDIFSLVDDAVADAYADARLRMSILADALVQRENTTTNAPAFTEVGFSGRPGARLHVMLKGGGSDNASRVVMLPPGAGYEGIEEAVVSCVREKGSSACPPLLIGIGVGATFDKVAGLAKKALLRPVGIASSDPRVAEIEERLLRAVNATGVGPAGLGGDTTALAVNINTAPCHIAALPLAINMGCCAMRSISLELEEA
ncbi:MAG: fumarate hydratase [Coriobacteriales bacterium]|jgi:fumarate hydratase subunit alpha